MQKKDRTITNNRLDIEINSNSHKVLKISRSKQESTSLKLVEEREIARLKRLFTWILKYLRYIENRQYTS